MGAPLPFRRRPPQSNCPSDTVSQPDKGCGLEGHNARVVSHHCLHRNWRPRFLRLLPILYMRYRHSISNYSKAPWGLSVPSRVTCIFTGTKISPSLSLRQCPNRYAFRAGRNYPDKEFRYLRDRYSYGCRLLGFTCTFAYAKHSS